MGKIRKNSFVGLILIFVVLVLWVGPILQSISADRGERVQKELALKSYVPYSYLDLIDTYGSYGPDYESAMSRYVNANMCDDIAEVISALENVDYWYRHKYDPNWGVPGVVYTAKGNDLLVGSYSVDHKMDNILKYSILKGTKGEIPIRGLKTLAAEIDSKIMGAGLTRSEWFKLKVVLIGWHDPEIMDQSLRKCVTSKIQNDGWTP